MTLGNTDGEIAGLTISDPPTPAEVQALRGACKELADDARALATLVHALRGALVAVGAVKGGGRATMAEAAAQAEGVAWRLAVVPESS